MCFAGFIRLSSTVIFISSLALAQSVTVTPTGVALRPGQTRQFSAARTGLASTAPITWMVNGTVGGDSTVGTISATGLYTASPTGPSSQTVQIGARILTTTGTVSVSLLNPTPTLTSIQPADFSITALRRTNYAFEITLQGTGFRPTTRVTMGTQNLTVTFVSDTQLRAAGLASRTMIGYMPVRVVNPDGTNTAQTTPRVLWFHTYETTPAISNRDAVRFLERASWGPTTLSVDRLQAIGVDRYLTEQFDAPPSNFDNLQTINPNDPDGVSPMQRRFFVNGLKGADQLRQRMVFALSQTQVSQSDSLVRMRSYWDVLNRHAFGNFLDLMRDVTLNPQMGAYLNMVNNRKAFKPTPTSTTILPNENYARELLQLFTIGTEMLNLNGTPILDANGVPVPSYGQAEVGEFSKSFTGWVYGAAPDLPMIPREEFHETSEKRLLRTAQHPNGELIPAGLTAREDLERALLNIFNHPNVGPYMSKRLIQHFTSSNPSPAYVARVATIFNNNGSGVRGDLKAVVRAILTDSEALSTASTNRGQLRAPMQFTLGAIRALDGTIAENNSLPARNLDQGQNPMRPPSVFSYFSPFFAIPGTTVVAPEFQINTAHTSIVRANWANSFAYNPNNNDFSYDLASWTVWGESTTILLDRINTTLFGGAMPGAMRTTLSTALQAYNTPQARAQAALSLALSSGLFQVID